MENERLNTFSKILITTGQINYLANTVHTVNQQLKMIPDTKGALVGSIENQELMLNDVQYKLALVMESLADFCNNTDIVMPIDERICDNAFDIILRGNDDTNV